MGKQILYGDQDLDCYVSLWESIQLSFFKLETRQEYEPEFSPGWKEFCSGDLDRSRELLREALLSDPAKPYEKIRTKGIQFIRVHVVKLPLSRYIEYEIESYWISISLGERIYFITDSDVRSLRLDTELQDFLLFDDQTVIAQNYGPSGDYVSSELIQGPEFISPYTRVRNELLAAATPMPDFLASRK